MSSSEAEAENETNTEVYPLDMYARLARRLSCLWAVRDYGDCQVRIHFTDAKSEVTKERSESEELNNQVQTTSQLLMCHSTVLSAGSDYFFKRLQSSNARSSDGNSVGRDNSSSIQYADGKEGGLTILVEHINEEDLAAFEHMIKFFYFAEIDASTSIATLVKLLQVSDRFVATECCVAVRHVLLEKISEHSTVGDFSDLCIIYDFEPANLHGWAAIEAAADEKLLSSFDSVYTIMNQEDMLESWCQLSWRTVRRVLTSEEFCTDCCEDTIACAVIHWLFKHMDFENLSNTEKHIIDDIEGNILRYGLMSVPFLSILLECCPWLIQAHLHAHEIYRYASLEPHSIERDCISLTFKSPSSWCKDRPYMAHLDSSCELEVLESEFRCAIKDYPNFQKISTVKFHRGWYVTMSIELNEDNLLCICISLKIACPVNSTQVVMPKCDRVLVNGDDIYDHYWEPGKGISYILTHSSLWGGWDEWPQELSFPDSRMLLTCLIAGAY